MIINVEFVGALRTVANANSCSVELEEGATMSALMHRLKAELFGEKEFADESNLLVMRNGKEISVLKGLQTELKHKDRITLIPISHGG